MKKIINGLRYNTENAVLIGEADNVGNGVDSATDFSYWSAGLYKTPRSARFFLAGEGGPMSRFSHTVSQNSWSGGSDLIPMTKEEAMEWAEAHLNYDEVEKHFSDLIEDA